MRRTVSLLILLLALSAGAFSPVLSNGFIDFDDGDYIENNRWVRNGLTAEGIRWAFTTFDQGNWHPLTWFSHMLDVEMFGNRPGGHHLTSLILHASNTLFLFAAMVLLTGAAWRSAAVAALFAIHPLHVESVAWAAERKDVLSTLFGLLALCAWLRYLRRPGWGRYAAVLVAYLFSLLCKPMWITFPFLMLVLDWWPLRRFTFMGAWRPVLEKLPLFAAAVASGVVTFIAQAGGGAVVNLEHYPIAVRAGNVAVAYPAYILKTIWPMDLAIYYPLFFTPPRLWQVLAGAALLLAASLAVWRGRRRHGYLLTGWLWFLGTLVPVVGLVQVGGQRFADRYTYLPLTGLFIILVWGAADLLGRATEGRWVLPAAAVLAIGGLAVLTWRQAGFWRDSETLFRHALLVTRENWLVHNGLGLNLYRRGMIPESLEEYRNSLRINPRSPETHNNIGLALVKLARYPEAAEHFRAALELKPRNPHAENNLGLALQEMGRYPEAAEHYGRALEMDPDFILSIYNLGNLKSRTGDYAGAVEAWRRVVRLAPWYADARYNLVIKLLKMGDGDGARVEYEALRGIDPPRAANLAPFINAGPAQRNPRPRPNRAPSSE